MITIVIIVLLSQTGSILNLFDAKESSELEGISVNILNAIDEEKTLALLGKTKDQEIVRTRKLRISSIPNAIEYATSINKAKDPADTYIDGINRNIPINENEIEFATCDDSNTGTVLSDTKGINVFFTGDTVSFEKISTGDTESAINDPHIVVSIGTTEKKREIHIDRRTGLSYERNAPNPGDISCQ